MRRLLEVGRTLVSELDPDKVLDLVLETAREVTSARYAALGVCSMWSGPGWSASSRGESMSRHADRSAIRRAAVGCLAC